MLQNNIHEVVPLGHIPLEPLPPPFVCPGLHTVELNGISIHMICNVNHVKIQHVEA